jgi:broad specificity phosphatase PhoE
MPVLYLIRHAEPVGAGRFLGSIDTELTSQGIAQARKLRDLNVSQAFTSPRLRARQTAAHLPVPAIVVPGLAERHYGEWEGLSWEEIEPVTRTTWDRVGEPWIEFEERVRAAWRQLEPMVGIATETAVVSHLGVNSVLSSLLRGTDPFCFQQEYGEVIQIVL